ncbi:hypothetical protein, partial [Escherichia coli]|uniref:hypothetical protein n=1 Tax=Escherichia coli TaxID=562 RepID=UPI001CDAD6E7
VSKSRLTETVQVLGFSSSRRIRHEIRRTGLTHLPDAPAYRAYRRGKPRLFALADTRRTDKAFYAASSKLQQITFSHAF